jgi:ribosomal protein S11
MILNQGLADIFVTKYNAAGDLIWTKGYGGTGFDEAYDIAVDYSENVYLTGYFYSATINFGSVQIQNTNSAFSESFVLKLDPNGNAVWAKTIGGAGFDAAYSITIDPLNNVIVTGGFSSSNISVEGTVLANQGNIDVFLIKYNTSGGLIWAKSFGSDGFEEGLTVKTDQAGNPILTGYFSSNSFSINNQTLFNYGVGTNDMFLAKFSEDGSTLWLRREGDSGNESGYDIFVDPSGSIFVCGDFDSPSPVMAGSTLSNAGSGDCFLAKYTSTGNAQWAKSLGGEGLETAYGVTGDHINNIYLTGSFSSNFLQVGSTQLENAGYYDVFLANLHADNTAAIHEIANSQRNCIYPNPSTGSFEIIIPDAAKEFKILNAAGQLIMNDLLQKTETHRKISLEQSGIYFLYFITDQEIITRKIIVTRN